MQLADLSISRNSAFPLIGNVCLDSIGCRLNAWPHGRKLWVRDYRCYLEFDSEVFDPRGEMSPDFANVACHGNGHPSASNWITYAIFQFKAIEFVARPPCIDVVGKRRACFPGACNCWEVPDDQIVLHEVRSKTTLSSRYQDSAELRLIHPCVIRFRLVKTTSAPRSCLIFRICQIA